MYDKGTNCCKCTLYTIHEQEVNLTVSFFYDNSTQRIPILFITNLECDSERILGTSICDFVIFFVRLAHYCLNVYSF